MDAEGAIPVDQPLASALRAYLPSSLRQQCLRDDELQSPRACAQHLDALLRAIATYLPHQVVAPLIDDPTVGRVTGDFAHGTVMFADISGFTRLSEALSQLGKAGAEEITSIVNHFFTALLDVAGGYGGDLIKFGGDALLLLFVGERHAYRACRAALQMQQAMVQFAETSTSQGTFQLQMSVGIGTGALFLAHLGSEESMEFAALGQAITQMAKAESLAAAGQIIIDDATYRAVAAGTGTVQVEPPADQEPGFHQLLAVEADRTAQRRPQAFTLELSPPSDHDALRWIKQTVQRIEALAPFLPPGLLDRMTLDPDQVVIGGEYRPVTIFFANFYGINHLIDQLGPAHSAEITAILNSHFTTMRQIIAKYGGVVNKISTYAIGYSIMALFGAPRAHIDDPERAVRAALEMQEAMAAFRQLDTSRGPCSVKQRIGVNTGLVFAGNVGAPTRREYSVMGDEVNLASRLMGVAPEGQVLISASTASQTEQSFLLAEREMVDLKGKAQPVHNYQVLGIQERRTGTAYRRPLVGRDAEWEIVHTVADQALAGASQVLTIVGDVGMGKSRLTEELVAHWSQEHGALHVRAACPSFGRHTPYLPWLDLLRPLFGFMPADSPAVKREKIEALLTEIDPRWRDWTPLIARLLGLEVEPSPLLRSLDAESRQRVIFRTVSGVVEHVAGEQPLLLTIDDLQWADETSVALVNRVARDVTAHPLLVMLAYRPDDALDDLLQVAAWPHHTNLKLEDLTDEAGLRLLELLLPTTPQMPQQLKQLILRNAQGNPLFIEEVAHALIENYLTLDEETGTYHARADLEEIEVPDTVNRVIMSRMDRLDESSRNVLRVASVIGREFKHWLLSKVYPYRRAEGELRERLNNLSQREILEGPYTDMLYLFRHIMTREVAYESLLYADRRQLHRHIGTSIEAQRAGRLSEYWEVLAYHFDLAGEWEKALDYHLKAANKAQEVYANEDAMYHFRQALEAAEQLSGSEQQRLEAHEGLGEVLTLVGRYDEALEHLKEAQGLAAGRVLAALHRKTAEAYEAKGDYQSAFDWLEQGLALPEIEETVEEAGLYRTGAGVFYRQGDNEQAREWCKRSLEVAERLDDEKSLAQGNHLLGAILIKSGELTEAVRVCKQSLSAYQELGELLGQFHAHNNLASAYYSQDSWGLAADHHRAAMGIVSQIGYTEGQAQIASNLGEIYLKQGELEKAKERYQAALAIVKELGIPFGEAILHNNLGAAYARGKNWRKASNHLEQSQALFEQIGSEEVMVEVLRHRAEVERGRGQLAQALTHAERSLDYARAHHMPVEEGTTLRVLGSIRRVRHELDQAEEALTQALALAQKANKRYETALTRLEIARLRLQQDRREEGSELAQQAAQIFADLGAQLDLKEAERVLMHAKSG